MATINSEVDCKFQVNLLRKILVKAKEPLPETHILSLSNLDLLSGRFPVTYFYFYTKPEKLDHHDMLLPSSSLETLQDSLSECLNLFYPFAGRIAQNSNSNEPEIICDNTGALLVEAMANIPLKHLYFYNLDEILQGKLVQIDHGGGYSVQVQITNYTCGGLSMTFTFDHALGDASSFGKFLVTWSELARKRPISCLPDHRRHLLAARNPPIYNLAMDETFISCTFEDIINIIPIHKILLKRLYYIDSSAIDKLQRLSSIHGKQRTKIESFSAYVWKVMARSLIVDQTHQRNKICKMGWLIDGRRTRIMSNNYIGNVLSLAFGEANVDGIEQGSLADAATRVHNAISEVTNHNEAHFLDLIDWIECHRPGLMLSKDVLGGQGNGSCPTPTIVVSSGRRFPVMELDFGFGSPVVGTVCSTVERIGVGYINQRQSGSGDGSWIVSVILWPKMVRALESDPERVFQPMSAQFLQL